MVVALMHRSESVFAMDKLLSPFDGMEHAFGNHPRVFLFVSSVNLINGVLPQPSGRFSEDHEKGTFVDKMLFIFNGVCIKRTHSFSGIVSVSAQIIIYGKHTKSYLSVSYSKVV